MNAVQLQTIIVASINQALNSGETHPGQVVAILEFAKLDVYTSTKKAEESKPKIVPIHGNLPPNLGGGR